MKNVLWDFTAYLVWLLSRLCFMCNIQVYTSVENTQTGWFIALFKAVPNISHYIWPYIMMTSGLINVLLNLLRSTCKVFNNSIFIKEIKKKDVGLWIKRPLNMKIISLVSVSITAFLHVCISPKGKPIKHFCTTCNFSVFIVVH